MTQKNEIQYVYVLTRRDLPFPQQAVQAAHASIEAARKFIDKDIEHPHLVLCTVENEEELFCALNELKDHVRIAEWREADIDDELTAIASEPVSGDVRRLFRNYQLLKGESLCVTS